MDMLEAVRKGSSMIDYMRPRYAEQQDDEETIAIRNVRWSAEVIQNSQDQVSSPDGEIDAGKDTRV